MVSRKIITDVSLLFFGKWALLNTFLVQIGDPTILINNAGVVQGKLVIDLSVEDVQQYVIPISSSPASQTVLQNIWCKHLFPFLDFKSVPSCDVEKEIWSYCKPSLTPAFTTC